MQNHEYEDAIRRELHAHQLAALRLQRLEAERQQAVLDMAMQRSLGIVHQPTTSLYYVEPPVSRPVLEDSWWAAPVRPRSYETWQQPQLNQLPPESYLVRRNVMTAPPAVALRTWEHIDDVSMQRMSSFGIPSHDRKASDSKVHSSDQPSLPLSSKTMPSPTLVSQHARSKLKLPSKNEKIAAKAAHVIDPKRTPKKRGRPLGSKNAVVVKQPSPPPTPHMRQSWNSLGLGTTSGTPAYNAHLRAVHRASGQPLPDELTPLDFAREIYSARVRKVPLPDQSPLQIFLEKITNDSKPVQQTVPFMSEKEDKKKSAKKSSDVDGESIDEDVKMHKKERKKKKGKNSNGSMALATPPYAATVQNDHDRVAKQQTTTEPLEVLTPFRHALHRLHKTILDQEMEDCATDMKKSHVLSAEDVRRKMKGFEDEIAELDKLEHQLVKESKQLNATNLVVLEDAYRLMGVMPPEGC